MVCTPALGLRSPSQDAALLRDVVRRADGPVVLVGHGYGGAVIAHAATGADHVVALCYVAAFGFDAGERLLDVINRFAPMPQANAAWTTDLPGDEAVLEGRELYLCVERFPQAYAGDLPLSVGAAPAQAHCPLAMGAPADRSGPPA
ncbi:alpha/beta fold hydrolase [Streptomyces canus]|uniref:alpha/beta fold hydrolase n=1 Tax=Streptomyces canus TaxID=58343 RepID=UPI0027864A12|nr:alpha/beta fold hydrolase [Streptomyces canus]MDQ1065095.1 pimeloyl-ACP methyl ester carboxylesterase [Streptomyces canus]